MRGRAACVRLLVRAFASRDAVCLLVEGSQSAVACRLSIWSVGGCVGIL